MMPQNVSCIVILWTTKKEKDASSKAMTYNQLQMNLKVRVLKR